MTESAKPWKRVPACNVHSIHGGGGSRMYVATTQKRQNNLQPQKSKECPYCKRHWPHHSVYCHLLSCSNAVCFPAHLPPSELEYAFRPALFHCHIHTCRRQVGYGPPDEWLMSHSGNMRNNHTSVEFVLRWARLIEYFQKLLTYNDFSSSIAYPQVH